MKTINKKDGSYEYVCQDWEMFFMCILTFILGILIGVIR